MTEQLTKIEHVVQRLDSDGILDKLTGNCVLAADIFQSLLNSQGVETRIIECELMITRTDPETGLKNINLIGYNLTPENSQVATHVILITQNTQPLLIDPSISQHLGLQKHVVIANLTKASDPDIICRTNLGSTELVYKIKKNIKLPNFHQRDLIARLEAEVETNRRVDQTRRWVYWAVGITAVNFFLNMTIISLNLFNN